MNKEYEKYIIHKDYYKYGYWPNSYYSFPVNSLCTNKYSYKEDILKQGEEFTQNLIKYIEEYFKDNPRRQYAVVKDLRYFYKNISLRKLMHLKDELQGENISFKITKIEEASNSSSIMCVREKDMVLSKKEIEKVLKESQKFLEKEFDKKNLKGKILKSKKILLDKDYFGKDNPGYIYTLKYLVSRR